MAYRLKSIRYKDRECHVLLQNENGPCPLIAAANCLLLQGRIALPAASIRNNVASLSDLQNVLANVALEEQPAMTTTTTTTTTTSSSSSAGGAGGGGDKVHQDDSSFHVHELLEHIIPALQYGMDVNPKFTAGLYGYEFTAQVHCFDTWRVPLVHGWLLDPHTTPPDLYTAIGQKTYNQVIELVIQGKEAEQALATVQAEMEELSRMAVHVNVDADASTTVVTPVDSATQQQAAALRLSELQTQQRALQHRATIGTWIDGFLQESAHQLTQYGLVQMHENLPEGSLAVFFRNNHFSTITVQQGLLYLLVTDLGYAGTPQIVWEKLDMINGDTEYVNSAFKTVGQVSQENNAASLVGTLSPEALLAQSSQKDADYHLALHLSMSENNQGNNGNNGNHNRGHKDLDAREGELMAAATEASLREYHGMTSTTTTAMPQVAMGVPLQGPPASGSGSGTRVTLPPKGGTENVVTTKSPTMMDADHLLALQLASQEQEQQHQASSATMASPSSFQPPCDDMASYRLAQQLQAEENQRATRRTATTATARPASGKSSNCVIS